MQVKVSISWYVRLKWRMLINALIKFHKSPPDLNLTLQMEACLGFLPEDTETVPILRAGLLEGKFWESAEPHMLNSFSDLPN